MPTWLTALLAGVLAVLARDVAKDLYAAAKTNWKYLQIYFWFTLSAAAFLYSALFFRPSDPIRPKDLWIAMTVVAFICLGISGGILHLIGRVLNLVIKHRDTTPDAK